MRYSQTVDVVAEVVPPVEVPPRSRARRKACPNAVSRSSCRWLPLALTVVFALTACNTDDDDSGGTGGGSSSRKPSYVGDVQVLSYDGVSDDLLTAGLGRTGLASAEPPLPQDPTTPTAAELRRRAIYSNYRALVDTSAGGGYGTLYGPNVDATGNATSSEGRIAGVEYRAFSDDGSGNRNVTLLVQIPITFDTANPCVMTAASSGSRGVYGAISAAEWGLKRGCAVAFTDKGTGAAPHDLMSNTVPRIDGTRVTRTAAGAGSTSTAQFAAPLGGTTLASFNSAWPNRQAFKHAHSQRNPEQDWGLFTLQSVEFALWAMGDRFRTTFGRDRVLVIASSVSNGGGAAIAAAEQDTQGLIDGVAVAEPMLNLPPDSPVVVRRGGAPVALTGRTLFDYSTLANLLQLCASQDPANSDAAGLTLYPVVPGVAQAVSGRCQALVEAGVITGNTTAQQGASAMAALRAYGWEPESDALHASLAMFEVGSAISVTFANALASASVTDRLCGYSFAATGDRTPTPMAVARAELAMMFATGNGVPPAATIQIVNDNDARGPWRDLQSRSPGHAFDDANLAGAQCLRNLLTGGDATSLALRAGQARTLRTGDLRGRPAIIVHGRDDALLPVNHTSRPYLGLNRVREGGRSRLSYIEVTNAQHFDGFIGVVPGYENRYVPLHLYLIRALDAVYANLRDGRVLPPSQVVRTSPRGGTLNRQAPNIAAGNVPNFVGNPGDSSRIVVTGNVVDVPD